jgi:hypothetical protein
VVRLGSDQEELVCLESEVLDDQTPLTMRLALSPGHRASSISGPAEARLGYRPVDQRQALSGAVDERRSHATAALAAVFTPDLVARQRCRARKSTRCRRRGQPVPGVGGAFGVLLATAYATGADH